MSKPHLQRYVEALNPMHACAVAIGLPRKERLRLSQELGEVGNTAARAR